MQFVDSLIATVANPGYNFSIVSLYSHCNSLSLCSNNQNMQVWMQFYFDTLDASKEQVWGTLK